MFPYKANSASSLRKPSQPSSIFAHDDEIKRTSSIPKNDGLMQVIPVKGIDNPKDGTLAEDKDVGEGEKLQDGSNDGSSKPRQGGWKPHSMRPPVLMFVIIISLALAAAVEILAQRSHKQGGLALSASPDDIPVVVNAAYLYLPTTLATLYSLLWTWIDLDIRRLQPWLELSREDGTTGESSLLLDYPFEFLAFVPFKAWRRRHWPVFHAGIAMMVIFWLITPLQSAIFGLQAVIVTEQTTMQRLSVLLPIEEQPAAMDVSVLNTAYGVTWLGQPIPDFMTAEHAFLPFSPSDSEQVSGQNRTWTGNTSRLSTDLDCRPASVHQVSESDPHTFTFDNGRGCAANISLLFSANVANQSYVVLYIGYWDNPQLDWYLESPTCGKEFSNQFLAIWALSDRVSDKVQGLTAVFCEASYYEQNVSVSIRADTLRPDEESVVSLGQPQILGERTFNSTAFEYLLHVGSSPVDISRDYASSIRLEQYPEVIDMGLSWPTSNMVGFALGQLNGSLTELQNATVLGNAFRSSHKILMSAAVARLLSPVDVPVKSPGSTQSSFFGVIVDRPIAIAVECLLLFITLLIALILFHCNRATSKLREDPASIGAVFNTVKSSPSVLNSCSSKDHMDMPSLSKSIANHRYKLAMQDSNCSFREPVLQISTVSDRLLNADHSDTPVDGVSSGAHYRPIRPKELRTFVGIPFICMLLIAMAFLIYLKSRAASLHGLPRPTTNFDVLQIIENYIPTIFATLLEPFFILLNRLLCILQPIQDLRKGGCNAANTIEAKYTSLPPQFTIYRALKSRHYLLATLCGVSLLANVLSISLGALFNEFPSSIDTPSTVQQLRIPSLARDTIVPIKAPISYYDHFYVALANISTGTVLPPWIDTQFAYFPFGETTRSLDNSSARYSSATRGFSVGTSCNAISMTSSDSPYAAYTLNQDGTQTVSVSYRGANGTNLTCVPVLGLPTSRPFGISAQEIYSPLLPPLVDGSDNSHFRPNDGGFCAQRILVGWMRASSEGDQGSGSMILLECVPYFQTAMFEVTVDSGGRVFESRRTSDFDSIAEFNDKNLTETLLAEANNWIGDYKRENSMDYGWHNDTSSRDWMNQLLKLSLNSSRLVDPAQPLPDATYLASLVETMFQRLSASLLGLNLSLFKAPSTVVTTTATVTAEETRIFMDNTAFIISVIILGLNIIVSTIFYARERHFYLPRLPSTIGSLIAYAAASRAIRQYEPNNSRKRKQGSDEEDPSVTYSFGRYVGVDGKAHVGIEIDPFVVPIGMSSLKEQDTSVRRRGPRWLRRREKPGTAPDGWL